MRLGVRLAQASSLRPEHAVHAGCEALELEGKKGPAGSWGSELSSQRASQSIPQQVHQEAAKHAAEHGGSRVWQVSDLDSVETDTNAPKRRERKENNEKPPTRGWQGSPAPSLQGSAAEVADPVVEAPPLSSRGAVPCVPRVPAGRRLVGLCGSAPPPPRTPCALMSPGRAATSDQVLDTPQPANPRPEIRKKEKQRTRSPSGSGAELRVWTVSLYVVGCGSASQWRA